SVHELTATVVTGAWSSHPRRSRSSTHVLKQHVFEEETASVSAGKVSAGGSHVDRMSSMPQDHAIKGHVLHAQGNIASVLVARCEKDSSSILPIHPVVF